MTTTAPHQQPPRRADRNPDRTRSGWARYAPLYQNLVRREVRQRYRGSALGVAWTLITPLVMVGSYGLVFRFMLRINIESYYLFLFVGLTIWQFLFAGMQMASASLVNNANLVTKVKFPREIVPLATLSGNAVTAGVMAAIALPLCVFISQDSPLPMVTLPGLVVLLACMTAGLGLLAAGLNVYFRDVEHILAAIGLPWIFVTPIFYEFDAVPGLEHHPWAEPVLHYANPFAPFVISTRDVLFSGTWPAPGDVLYCAAAAAISLSFGLWAFRRLEREMAIEL